MISIPTNRPPFLASLKIKVLRSKDRITHPKSSGYRDLLLNITVEGFDMIFELQMHFKDIITIKESVCVLHTLREVKPGITDRWLRVIADPLFLGLMSPTFTY